MIDRILDFSDVPARLSLRRGLLAIRVGEEPEQSVPLADLAVIVAAHPQISFSLGALAGLAEAGVMTVVCGPNRMPAGMLLPMMANYVQTERFTRQATTPQPTRKRLWQQVVRAKVRAQAGLLERLHGDDAGLDALAGQVRSGDSGNVEARAARRYWGALFPGGKFSRNREGEDQNRFLNYGYMVLRAVVARAVCAAGLHPSLGLHHHNRYDAFCLASDLMEPFRPLVDEAVVELLRGREAEAPLDKEAKGVLLQWAAGRHKLDDERRTVFDIAARMAVSLVAVHAGERKDLLLPEF